MKMMIFFILIMLQFHKLTQAESSIKNTKNSLIKNKKV